jgi:acetoin:2,6-dichlorophenolindophenol oxidoreductase subunit beta
MSTQFEVEVENEPRAELAKQVLTYRKAVNAALMDAMTADERVVLLGEDVGILGGVWYTNVGLAERFGARRVINTPICENGFVGAALGMSLMGQRPVVEFMFADFLPTAADAIINQLAKYRYMSGGKCAVPVTIRAVSGGTGRFGTQHSATGESWFMNQPGLRVATASTPGAAYAIIRAAIRENNPVLVHEHRALYMRKGEVDRTAPAEVGRADTMRHGNDVTILATLLMVERALEAAKSLEAEGISAEVIDLRWIRPLDMETIRASVERTGRLVVVEEQVHAGGWGATVISTLTMGGTHFLSPPRAVSIAPEAMIPYSPPLEDATIPSVDDIIAAARRTMG